MPLSKIDSDSLSAPLTVPTGSAAAPAITTTGDTNTGIFFPAADTIGFAEGGAEVMRIDSSGNVGISTSSAGVKLQISGQSGRTSGLSNPLAYFAAASANNNDAGVVLGSVTGNFPYIAASKLGDGNATNLGFFTNDTERARIDSSGNVGVGTSSPVAASLLTLKKTSAGGDGAELRLINSSTTVETATQIVFTNTTTDSGNSAVIKVARTSGGQDFRFASDGTERVRIESGGSLLMTTARSTARGRVDIPDTGGTQSVPLAVSRGGDAGTMVNFFSTNSTTTTIGTIGNSGNTNTTYNTSSDYRLKEDIAPMTGALAKVALLKPSIYRWKSTGATDEGFIAHELAEVCPSAVTGEKDAVDEDGNIVPQGIDTSFLVATLTAAIQELKAIVDAQGAEIAALKGTP